MSACTLTSHELHRALRAVALAAGTDSERPHMNAVHFAASDELVLTATNGHWVAQWKCEPKECSPTSVKMLARLDDVKRLLPLLAYDAAHGKNEATIEFEDGKVFLENETVLSLQKVGADFVDIEKVWPTTPLVGVPFVGFFTNLLTRAAKAFKSATGDDVPLRFQFREVEGPISVYSDSVPELAVLLMPARVEQPNVNSPEGKRQLTMFGGPPAAPKPGPSSVDAGADETAEGDE